MNEHLLLVGLAVGLVLAAYTDVREYRIPNWLTGSLVCFGIGANTWMKGWSGFLFSVEGMLVGLACLMFFFIQGGMGAGDVKLLAAIGAIIGTKQVFFAFCFAAMLGGIYSLVVLFGIGGFRYLWERVFLLLTTLRCSQSVITAESANGTEPKLRYALVIGLGTIVTQTLFLYGVL